MYLIGINMVLKTKQIFYLEAYSEMNRVMLGLMSNEKFLAYWRVIPSLF
jgi:hypothetical protein